MRFGNGQPLVGINTDAVGAFLAGDLVERDNALFEAYGPLATGVRRLVERGIVVAAVAGNHDTMALPRLAAEIDGEKEQRQFLRAIH